MSTVKISQLSEIQNLNSNTSNTIIVGVDLPTMVTGKITATTLAHGLYRYNQLNVGNNEDEYPNTIAQFAGTSNNYIQVNLENINDDNGTADYVVGANTGSDSTYYLDMGYANKDYNNLYPNNSLGTSLHALDGYIYVQGSSGQTGGNLVIGTTISGTETKFIAGGINQANIVAKITQTGINLTNNSRLTFNDLTTQSTAASPALYTEAAFETANSAHTNLDIAITTLEANDATTLSVAESYTDTANTKMKSYVDTANTSLKSYVDTANTSLKSYVDNNYLANTTGIFDGDLTVSGNTEINGYFNIVKSDSSESLSLVNITGSDNGAVVAPSNSFYMLHVTGKENNSTRVQSGI
jgi:hypothetical protein